MDNKLINYFRTGRIGGVTNPIVIKKASWPVSDEINNKNNSNNDNDDNNNNNDSSNSFIITVIIMKKYDIFIILCAVYNLTMLMTNSEIVRPPFLGQVCAQGTYQRSRCVEVG